MKEKRILKFLEGWTLRTLLALSTILFGTLGALALSAAEEVVLSRLGTKGTVRLLGITTGISLVLVMLCGALYWRAHILKKKVAALEFTQEWNRKFTPKLF